MNAFSLLRKLLLILAAVFTDFTLLQIISALYIQQVYTFYVLTYWPMQENRRDFIEVFNEITIFALVIMLSALTDYVADPKIRYTVGWALIYIIFLQVGVNTAFLFFDLYHYLQRVYKIIRYHKEMRFRAKAAERHNKIVDLLQLHKKQEQIQHLKMQNPYQLQQQVDLMSESNQSCISKNSVASVKQNDGKIMKKSILQRKREFEQLMQQLAKTEQKYETTQPFTRNEFNPPLFKREEINGILPEFDSDSNERIKLQDVENKLLLKLQQGNDWPVSPNQAKFLAKQNKLVLPQIQQSNGINPKMWDYDNVASNASDWNALPWEKNSNSFCLDSSFSSQHNKHQLQKKDGGFSNVKKVGNTRHKTTIMWNQKLELSVPDANVNSANQSRWRDEDSSILELTLKPAKAVNSSEIKKSTNKQLQYSEISIQEDQKSNK